MVMGEVISEYGFGFVDEFSQGGLSPQNGRFREDSGRRQSRSSGANRNGKGASKECIKNHSGI
jgi:hypothetical protein